MNMLRFLNEVFALGGGRSLAIVAAAEIYSIAPRRRQ
jgi:hypothetical protein